MASIDEVYAGSSLKAADLNGSEVELTIGKAERKDFDDGNKIVVGFLETEKTFIVNKTNATRIAKLHGKDYEKWHGKKITIQPEMVDFKGDMVEAIRVKVAVQPTAGGRPAFLRTKEDLPDDEIPF